MRRPPDHAPSSAPRLERVRCVQVRGSGAVVLILNGTGRITLRRGRGDDFRFQGRGTPRFLSGECILLAGADGRLEVRGLQLELEFTGGTAELQVDGEFAVEARRRGKASALPGRRRFRAA